MAGKPTYEELEQRIRVLEEESIKGRKAKEELRQSEERFRMLSDKSPVGISLIGMDGRYEYVNPVFVNTFGYDLSEIPTGKDWFRLAYPDPQYRREVIAAWQEDLRRYPEREVRPRTYEVMCKGGARRTILFRPVSLHSGKQFVVYEDITEHRRAEEALKKSEERYRSILENIEEGYYELDLAGNLIFFNDSVCRLFGDSNEELKGINYRKHAEADTAKTLYKTFNEVYTTGQPTKGFDWEIIRKDGTKRIVEASVSLMKDAEGRSVGFRGIIRDVTDRKWAEEERDRLKAQLQQAQKMESVGRLAGGVAHDFNNMLGIIIGNAELAALQIDPEEPIHQSIQEILKAAHRSADTVRQLLAFARKQTISPKVLDLNETVQGMIKMLRRLIGEDIELRWIPGKDVWSVKVDATQISQILANLVVNSRDAIDGVGTVTLETDNVILGESYCREHEGFVPGNYVLLAVTDSGAGMTPEIMEHLFDPFFTTKELGRGTGLGLATVYGIVKQNNGFINVYSEPGQGTTFKIYLPRHQQDTVTEKEDPAAKHLLGGTETILVVEDEEALLKVSKANLEGMGYTVLTARAPSQAVSLVENHRGEIHLLLTDVVMPGMNGRELMERLRPLRPAMKSIFMSGYTANVIAHRGVLDKGVYFIQKPFSSMDLAKKVREALDKA